MDSGRCLTLGALADWPVAKHGFRIVVTVGLALGGLGLLALGFVHEHTGYGNVWWRLAIIGLGFGLTMSLLTGAAIAAVSPQEGGLASGISSTTRQIGAVLGVAVLGAIVHSRSSGGASFEAGLNSAFIAAGAVTLVSAVFTGLWLANSNPAKVSAPQAQPTDPPTVTTPS
ncbi:MFS transporter [Actinomadura sp. NPDC047616]|uniref:MFS transporter n=1 Tax=Actinomadura sp. NPDC047616 TaxID=3155914 RepID=UPI0033DE8165